MGTLSYVVGTFQATPNATANPQTGNKLTIVGTGFAANQALTCTTNINGSVNNLAVSADSSGNINQIVLCPNALATSKLPLVGSTSWSWTGSAAGLTWTQTVTVGADTVSVTLH